MCHVVLTMPIWGLVVFYIWPLSIAMPVYGFILVSSGILYYALMQTMHMQAKTGKEGLKGQIAEAIENLNPVGQVLVHGEIWRAHAADSIRKGEAVLITGMDGLTLRVSRWTGKHDPEILNHSHCVI